MPPEIGTLPAPDAVLRQFWVSMTTEALWLDIALSARRVLLGLGLGMLLAVPVGFLIGSYRPVRRFVDPLVNFFRALPPIALIPPVHRPEDEPREEIIAVG